VLSPDSHSQTLANLSLKGKNLGKAKGDPSDELSSTSSSDPLFALKSQLAKKKKDQEKRKKNLEKRKRQKSLFDTLHGMRKNEKNLKGRKESVADRLHVALQRRKTYHSGMGLQSPALAASSSSSNSSVVSQPAPALLPKAAPRDIESSSSSSMTTSASPSRPLDPKDAHLTVKSALYANDINAVRSFLPDMTLTERMHSLLSFHSVLVNEATLEILKSLNGRISQDRIKERAEVMLKNCVDPNVYMALMKIITT